MYRLLIPTVVALFSTFIPSRARAQWFSCAPPWQHDAYGMRAGWTVNPPPRFFTAPAPIHFPYHSPWYATSPIWSPPSAFNLSSYWHPQMNFVIPPAPPIPASTYRVHPIVTSCRWLRLGSETCLWQKTLAPDSRATDEGILLSIANAMRWGTGYAVVAQFTEHADHTLEVSVHATPIYPGYVPQTVTGRATTSVMAMLAALANAGTQTVR